VQNEQYTTNQTNVGVNDGEHQTQDANRGNPSVRQQANEVKNEIKEQASQAAHEVREQAKQISTQFQQNASELTSQAKDKASETLNDAKRQAVSEADARKGIVADRLQGVATALRDTSNKLQEQDEAVFADYASSAAEQVERFSGYLRDQSVGDLVNDVQSFARRQPELFLAGALAAGFMLGRFFKSSDRSYAASPQRYDRRAYPTQGVGYGEGYGAYGSPNYADPYAQSQYNQGRYGQRGYRQGESTQSTTPYRSGQSGYSQGSYSQSDYNQGSAAVSSTGTTINSETSYKSRAQGSNAQPPVTSQPSQAQTGQKNQEQQEKSEAQR